MDQFLEYKVVILAAIKPRKFYNFTVMKRIVVKISSYQNLSFVRNMLMPGEFAAYGLVITAVAAGTASFFSPCSFTVLPSYIAFASSGQNAEPG